LLFSLGFSQTYVEPLPEGLLRPYKQSSFPEETPCANGDHKTFSDTNILPSHFPVDMETAWIGTCSCRRAIHPEAFMAEDWIEDVLSFWFDEVGRENWFRSTKELDETIRRRFGALHERLSADLHAETPREPRAALAAVILFD